MNDFLPVLISLVVVMALVMLISRRFKLSSRYERKPRELNTWSSLDHGIDPTTDDNSKEDRS
jgi:hypothetical protein